MRYKDLVLKKLEQLEFLVNGLQGEISRNSSQTQLITSTEKIKERLEDVTHTVSLEDENR